LASNLVIAALPAEGDDVWKVSSEKKPHLTILFLGEAMTNPNVTKITETVKDYSQHLDPFSLLVDHRGFLGDDEADVLFFTEDIPWKLYDFRSMLLANQEISMAYNAIPQHQKWKPHLTLGYPETPAHADDWDPMGTQYVSFDRVAVWYGDYEGAEFTLTESPKPREFEDSPVVAGWADKVGNMIAHYGVKGMKWGRRKSEGTSALSEDAARASAAKAKAKKEGTQALSNKEMRDLVTRMQLEKQLKDVTPSTRVEKGAKFTGKLLERHANRQVDALVDYGVNKALEGAGVKKKRR